MMRLRIGHKLFLAFLLVAISVLASTAVLTRWSFQRGFLDYINEQESRRISDVMPALAQAYDMAGGWYFLQDNPEAWRHLLRPAGPTPLQFPPHHGRPPPPGGGLPPPDLLHIGPRISLFDAQKQLIIAGPEAPTQMNEHPYPITSHDQLVGYLCIAPLQELTDRLDVQFAERQTQLLYLISVTVLLMVTLLSLWLTRHWVMPIRRLTAGTHQLANGYYTHRLAITSRDELGELAQNFNQLAETLTHNQQARRQWIADISHELRTPLTILCGEIQALQDGVRVFDAKTLQSLDHEVQRLNQLVEDLYQLTLSDMGALNYQKEHFNLITILKETLTTFQSRLEAQRLKLDTDWPRMPLWVCADSKRLTQLFANLLENTIRYTDKEGLVHLKCSREGSHAIIDLQDSCPSVPLEALPHLFERFYRTETSRNRNSGGAGLGLAICKNIVEAHSGRIIALPSPLGGVWIRVELPLANGEQDV